MNTNKLKNGKVSQTGQAILEMMKREGEYLAMAQNYDEPWNVDKHEHTISQMITAFSIGESADDMNPLTDPEVLEFLSAYQSRFTAEVVKAEVFA